MPCLTHAAEATFQPVPFPLSSVQSKLVLTCAKLRFHAASRSGHQPVHLLTLGKDVTFLGSLRDRLQLFHALRAIFVRKQTRTRNKAVCTCICAGCDRPC